mgnify:CR=1 FL=1
MVTQLVNHRAYLRKVARVSAHVGYWSMVSGFVVSNFLYYGILQEKIRNDNLET